MLPTFPIKSFLLTVSTFHITQGHKNQDFHKFSFSLFIISQQLPSYRPFRFHFSLSDSIWLHNDKNFLLAFFYCCGKRGKLNTWDSGLIKFSPSFVPLHQSSLLFLVPFFLSFARPHCLQSGYRRALAEDKLNKVIFTHTGLLLLEGSWRGAARISSTAKTG